MGGGNKRAEVGAVVVTVNWVVVPLAPGVRGVVAKVQAGSCGQT